ncbi:MAG: hypothetical protein ABEH43_03215, partial [Flavobacteriales bacterium]
PFLVNPEKGINANAFEDYDPQVNLQPRISFAFNITQKALFTAHYDVLVQRPQSGVRLDPTDFLFVENQDLWVNNSNLKPSKTIEYAVGFQQVLSKNTSVKIETFYREMRNMIQRRQFVGAYPRTYKSWGNLDFGTTKGMSIKFDLRRVKNVKFKANYTLQFASSTGSSQASQRNLINAGKPNIRSVNPTSNDQRHRFQITADYRFKGGKKYNGPVWFGKQIFANTGLSLQSRIGSGTPYTRQQFATGTLTNEGGGASQEGDINGSRKPWIFGADIRLDRDIKIGINKNDEGVPEKQLRLNVYLRVNNVFNRLNIQNVYSYTGDPDDDGWLTSPQGRSLTRAKINPASYRDMYRMGLNNPFNYARPRVIIILMEY